MIKCPNCGSTAQVKIESLYFHDDEDEVERIKICVCGCGQRFRFLEVFNKAGYGLIEKM